MYQLLLWVNTSHFMFSLKILFRYQMIFGSRINGEEALCITLKRLDYPNRLSDMAYLFGRSSSTTSLIFNQRYLYNNHRDRISNLEQDWIKPQDIATAMHQKGAPPPSEYFGLYKRCIYTTFGTASSTSFSSFSGLPLTQDIKIP